MNNYKKNCVLKAGCALLLVLLSFSAIAQERNRVFAFKPGETYQSEVLTSSNAVVQRGKQKLNINTVSNVTKTFTNILANDKGYTFNAKIVKMDNEIEAIGKKLYYNSTQKNDTSSKIIKALDFMLNKPVDVQVSKYGMIQSYTDYKAELATDTLVAFAGIQPEVFEKGTMLNFLANFTYNPNIQKNFSWGDSIEIDKQRLITKFWVEDINPKNTIIKFSSSITTRLINTNQNGTYVIDNATGIIQEKIVYSVSTGYQISAGGILYGVARSTSMSQKTRRIK